ncbi:MAG TPA: hypothetical protein VGL86_19280 [Polyangia bacterium]
MLGGLAGGTAAVIATQRFHANPSLVAAGAAAAGLAAMTLGKQPWLRQAGAGAVVGAAVVGTVPHIVSAFSKHAPHREAQAPARPQPTNAEQRAAEGDGFVTRQELNDALGKLADSHKETQKQQTCDLLTALRSEIRQVIADGPNGPGLPAAESSPALPSKASGAPQYTSPLRPTRDANGEDYERNAYGDDIRDAEADDYTRNAYGDDIRDADADDYARNAYGEDMRDASAYDERDANTYDERDADERDADGYERDASTYDERDADAYERDASSYDERDADGELAAA